MLNLNFNWSWKFIGIKSMKSNAAYPNICGDGMLFLFKPDPKIFQVFVSKSN
jgi:hypothetical protein